MKVYLLCISICYGMLTFGVPQQFISGISVKDQTITYYLNKDFHAQYLRDNLFVTYQKDIHLHSLDYTILTMPLIMNTISMIWASGNEYSIPAMDKNLYESLETVHEVFKRFYPHTAWRGRLIPETLVESKIENTHDTYQIAIPFSCGLDSVCSSLRHWNKPQMLITVRGCPDTPLDIWNNNWQVTKKNVQEFAKQYGHGVSFIFSNFHEFFNWEILNQLSPEITNWRMDTIEDLGWIGLTAPILAQHGIEKLVIASNEDWSILHPGASCPLIIDTVSFAHVTITCDAFDTPRPVKNEIISSICKEQQLKRPEIFVCEHITSGRKNCCKCQKCAITILSFLLAGEDPQAYGFTINRTDFFDYVKTTYFQRNLYSPHRATWFKHAQRIAHNKLAQFDQETHDFFTWFISIDFDKLTLPNPQVDINYELFRDLWQGIPLDWQHARTSIATTHSEGQLTDKDYQHVWEQQKITW